VTALADHLLALARTAIDSTVVADTPTKISRPNVSTRHCNNVDGRTHRAITVAV